MKYLRHFCAITIFTIALAFPAMAGEMGFPVAPPDPPDQQTVAGEMDCPITSTGEETSVIDPLAEFARSFINVLSAF